MFTKEQRVQIARFMFQLTFKFASATEQRAVEQKGVGKFTPMGGNKGLRGIDAELVDGTKVRFAEQNKNKDSWCGQLAKDGIKCGWMLNPNADKTKGESPWLSFMIEHEGKIHIITPDKARDTVTGWFRKEEAKILDGLSTAQIEAGINALFEALQQTHEESKLSVAAKAGMELLKNTPNNTPNIEEEAFEELQNIEDEVEREFLGGQITLEDLPDIAQEDLDELERVAEIEDVMF